MKIIVLILFLFGLFISNISAYNYYNLNSFNYNENSGKIIGDYSFNYTYFDNCSNSMYITIKFYYDKYELSHYRNNLRDIIDNICYNELQYGLYNHLYISDIKARIIHKLGDHHLVGSLRYSALSLKVSVGGEYDFDDKHSRIERGLYPNSDSFKIENHTSDLSSKVVQ